MALFQTGGENLCKLGTFLGSMTLKYLRCVSLLECLYYWHQKYFFQIWGSSRVTRGRYNPIVFLSHRVVEQQLLIPSFFTEFRKPQGFRKFLKMFAPGIVPGLTGWKSDDLTITPQQFLLR